MKENEREKIITVINSLDDDELLCFVLYGCGALDDKVCKICQKENNDTAPCDCYDNVGKCGVYDNIDFLYKRLNK